MRKTEDCSVCRLVRFYLLLSVPLIAVLGMGSLNPTAREASEVWFARVELINFLAGFALLALLAIVAYRAYTEYVLPRKRIESLNDLRERLQGTDKGC